MKTFGGKVLFLDRADINTDEIIPAKYLTEITKEAMKPHLLEDLKLEGFDRRRDIAGKRVVVTRENFGCGSSREHAPWAFEVNDITAIIAPSFARIFRQNMYNCGMLALELPAEAVEDLFARYASQETILDIDPFGGKLKVRSGDSSEEIEFKVHGFDAALIAAGGWVEYADSKY
ncbi:MAG: 3-isopropylmalate dehydratase small subunit [Deltaproteobacteria bacterium]|nr:3-isopropylmalate dehydratase small subunit [Deltaproteobacteria bacterium]